MVWTSCVLPWALLLLSVLRTLELLSEYLTMFALQIYWFINSQTRHLMTSMPYSKITQEHRHSNAKSMKFDLRADCEINKLVCGLWITKRLLSLNHCTVWRLFLCLEFHWISTKYRERMCEENHLAKVSHKTRLRMWHLSMEKQK